MNDAARTHKCPTCGRDVAPRTRAADAYPFCSARCQWVDLGKWLREAYGVPIVIENAPSDTPNVNPEA